LRWAETLTELTRVSFVMPVMNEEHYLARAVKSVLAQKTPGLSEIILALGPSTDKTNLVASGLARDYAQVKLVDSPTGLTSASLNLAIAQSSYEVVIRVDAHSQLPEGYALLAVKILNDTGSANVGGRMHAIGESSFQKAVAFGYNNRIGLGGGSYHVGGKAGAAESVYLGCYRKSVLEELGGFSTKWVRGQDWELNQRILKAGYQVWFDPRLAVGYYPRRSWSALAKQFFTTGRWRGALTRSDVANSRLRYWLPPLLVVASLFWLPLWFYLLTIAFYAAGTTSLSWSSRFWLMLVLPTMHLSWGIGFWAGLIQGVK
jgi:glycosyltransferase involved in cell wall biosynthesis